MNDAAPSPTSLRPALAKARTLLCEALAETLWPTRCALCDAPGLPLCPTCRRQLPFIDALTACPRCGAPYGLVQCTECTGVMTASAGYDRFPLDAMASAVVLTGRSRRLVTTYKDQGEQRLAHDLAALMAPYIPPSWYQNAPALAYIPATGAARRRRGFDHGALLAQALAQETSLPVAPLLAVPSHRDQRLLTRRERAANASNSLSVVPGASVPSALIIIDDVCTTGSTLYAAATALRHAGADALYGLTFARA